MPRAPRRATAPVEQKLRSGRRTLFPEKEPTPYSVLLTRRAGVILRGGSTRLKVSRSDFAEACIRTVGPSLTRLEIERLRASHV